MMKSLIIFLLAFQSLAIFIPLTYDSRRCMIIYSISETETVKLQANFPPMPNQISYERYLVTWKNTQSNEENYQQVFNGKFKKQLSLSTNVIYDVCFSTKTQRDFGQVEVQYTASNLFSLNQAEVKVPDSLLKTKDVTDTFLNAEEIQRLADAFVEMQNDRSKVQEKAFNKTTNISTKMIQISFFELVIIILAGLYQFFSIRRYLQDKQYI